MPIRPENRARYPKDWKLRSHFVRHYRAKNRCEWCGVKDGEMHPTIARRVYLTTAHPYDDRPDACSLLNLAVLCQKCRNKYDAMAGHQRREERIAIEGEQHAVTN